MAPLLHLSVPTYELSVPTSLLLGNSIWNPRPSCVPMLPFLLQRAAGEDPA